MQKRPAWATDCCRDSDSTVSANSFTGVIESDCGAISGIQSHGNAKNQEGAAVAAVKATCDVECDSAFKNNLVKAEGKGEVNRAALAAAAARVFKGRFQIGQFDPKAPPMPWDSLTSDAVYSKANQQLALEGAQQSAVLLRNPASAGQAHLPLTKGIKIAIIGPNGNVPDVFQGQYHGGSCPTDSPDHDKPPKPYSPTYDYDCLPTLFSEVQKMNAGGKTTYANGCALSPSANDGSGHPEGQPCATLSGMDAVMAAAKAADVVILALGLDIKMTNKEGQDRDHGWTGYALPGMQQELARQIATLGKPTLVVELSGMAVGMDYIASQVNWPLIVGGYGGRFGPVALSQILFGAVSPTGRLPYTVYPEVWANNTNMTDMGLMPSDHSDGRTYKWYKGTVPAPWLFGEGMTYTNFSLAVAGAADGADSPAGGTYTATVTNTGGVAAAQTVMLFARPVSVPDAPAGPLPNRQLFDFGRTPTLAPGASAKLSFTVTSEAVALVDWAGSKKAYAGSYEIEFSTGGKAASHVEKYAVAATTTLSTVPPPHKNP